MVSSETIQRTSAAKIHDRSLFGKSGKDMTRLRFLSLKANVCSMIGYYTPYLFIVKAAELERSIPKNTAVYYLSVIGNRESVMDSSDIVTLHRLQ